MATLTLTPSSGTMVQHGGFHVVVHAVADNGITVVSNSVTGPVPAPDFATVGTQSLVYTLPQNLSGGLDEVQVEIQKTFSLTVTPGSYMDPSKFINGQATRYNIDTAGTTYEAQTTIANDSDDTTEISDMSMAYLDEGSMDPFEVAAAKKMIP